MLSSRAVGRSENSGEPVLCGGHNLPPLVVIGLTDLSKYAMAPSAPGTTGQVGIQLRYFHVYKRWWFLYHSSKNIWVSSYVYYILIFFITYMWNDRNVIASYSISLSNVKSQSFWLLQIRNMKDSRGILQKDFVIYEWFLLDFGLVFTWYTHSLSIRNALIRNDPSNSSIIRNNNPLNFSK